VVVPTVPDQEAIHRAIYEELIHGRVEPSSVNEFIAVARSLSERGADAVLLACTELELLVRHIDTEVRMLDSTQIHANAAWEVSVSGNLSHALLL
jgi:aspartate racemase